MIEPATTRNQKKVGHAGLPFLIPRVTPAWIGSTANIVTLRLLPRNVARQANRE